MAARVFSVLPRVAARATASIAVAAVRVPVLSVRTFATAASSAGAQVQTFLDRKEVTERVINVIKSFEKVDAAKVSPTAHFVNDLSLDSLDAVEVCMALEEEFVITIPDAEAEKILSVEDAVNFISTHPQAK